MAILTGISIVSIFLLLVHPLLQRMFEDIQLTHSHKKWKDSLEKRVILLIFLLEFEISGVAVQKIHQNNKI